MSKIAPALAASTLLVAACMTNGPPPPQTDGPAPEAPPAPSAAPAAPAPAAEKPAAPSVDQVVAVRQAAMTMSSAVLELLKGAADSGADVKKQAYPAGGLARWARTLPTMFPDGSGPGASAPKMKAKGEVWSDRAGFYRAADDFVTAASKLRDSAGAGDAVAFKTGIDAVQKTCDACHTTYKEPYKGK